MNTKPIFGRGGLRKQSAKGPKARLLQLRGEDGGAVAVEFAILAPIFLMLAVAVMVFAVYFTTLIGVIHSANEGARASVRGVTTADRQARALARIQQISPTCMAASSSSGPCTVSFIATPAADQTFSVRVSYRVSDFNFGWFYDLFSLATDASLSQPSNIGYTATIGNGGYGV